MIVITNPSTIANEISVIDSLFGEGLSLLHIRKPDFSEVDMEKFIHQIKQEYREKLVLHNHHEIAANFGINRIHFSETQRKKNDIKVIENMILSTSTHSIEDFNALENIFEYSFLSPVFRSISKENYNPKTNLFEDIKQRKKLNTKMIALGGIHSGNIEETLRKGFDDVALLGTIWNSPDSIKNFKLCQKIVLSLSA
ncbi:thiamine phosphate synthase [Flavobacterium cheongpyeongense]|uniref:Thiamine phosphate synthase n=1 Tax=Flavobacterium cheongpyeongense TaxID=2212651 RepID=A0A2V4BJ16_9FLAO|nr:thiamine phosphate synthase [Flavobacterium cheongpyeongense]PXY38925.1 thiamine phosphate synthase [Flavobacterium cheongpyeongense]